MTKFLTSQFWFQLNPELSYSFVTGLLYLALIFLVVAAYGYWRQKEKTILRSSWRALMSFGIANFLTFILWWIFTLEGVPLLSMRFWFVVFAVVDIIWLYRIYKRIKRKSELSPEAIAKRLYRKYLP